MVDQLAGFYGNRNDLRPRLDTKPDACTVLVQVKQSNPDKFSLPITARSCGQPREAHKCPIWGDYVFLFHRPTPVGCRSSSDELDRAAPHSFSVEKRNKNPLTPTAKGFTVWISSQTRPVAVGESGPTRCGAIFV